MPKTKNRCWHRNKILQPFLPCFFIPRTTLISVYKVQTMPQAKHKRAAKVDMYRGKRLPVAWTRSRKSMGNITWVVCYPLSGRAHEKKKKKKKKKKSLLQRLRRERKFATSPDVIYTTEVRLQRNRCFFGISIALCPQNTNIKSSA